MPDGTERLNEVIAWGGRRRGVRGCWTAEGGDQVVKLGLGWERGSTRWCGWRRSLGGAQKRKEIFDVPSTAILRVIPEQK